MDITCDLVFSGNSLQWIQEDKEEKTICLTFRDDGLEQNISFTQDCFKTVARLMNRFFMGDVEHDGYKGAKIVKNPSPESGEVKVISIYVGMDEEDVIMHVDDWDPNDEFPLFSISSKEESVGFCFSVAQAKKIISVCQKIIEIHDNLKELKKKKTVKAKSA